MLTLLMTEIQPQLAALIRRQKVVAVRYGNKNPEPVLAIIPYGVFQLAYGKSKETRLFSYTQVSMTEAHRLVLSYKSRLAPLLGVHGDVTRGVLVSAHRQIVAVFLAWEDWKRLATPEMLQEEDEEVNRTWTAPAVRHRLPQIIEQFAQEEAAGTLQSVIVTKYKQPVFAIVPWSLYKRWQKLLIDD